MARTFETSNPEQKERAFTLSELSGVDLQSLKEGLAIKEMEALCDDAKVFNAPREITTLIQKEVRKKWRI